MSTQRKISSIELSESVRSPEFDAIFREKSSDKVSILLRNIMRLVELFRMICGLLGRFCKTKKFSPARSYFFTHFRIAYILLTHSQFCSYFAYQKCIDFLYVNKKCIVCIHARVDFILAYACYVYSQSCSIQSTK